MSNTNQSNEALMLKPAAVCKLMGISMATLNRWIKQKKAPKHIYLNGNRYWLRTDVVEHVEKLFSEA